MSCKRDITQARGTRFSSTSCSPQILGEVVVSSSEREKAVYQEHLHKRGSVLEASSSREKLPSDPRSAQSPNNSSRHTKAPQHATARQDEKKTKTSPLASRLPGTAPSTFSFALSPLPARCEALWIPDDTHFLCYLIGPGFDLSFSTQVATLLVQAHPLSLTFALNTDNNALGLLLTYLARKNWIKKYVFVLPIFLQGRHLIRSLQW